MQRALLIGGPWPECKSDGWLVLQAYLRSHAALRVDMHAWRVALLAAMEHDPHARRRMLEVAGTLEALPESAGAEADLADFCAMFLVHSDQVRWLNLCRGQLLRAAAACQHCIACSGANTARGALQPASTA